MAATSFIDHLYLKPHAWGCFNQYGELLRYLHRTSQWGAPYSTYATQHSGHFSPKRVDFRWFTTRKGGPSRSKTGPLLAKTLWFCSRWSLTSFQTRPTLNAKRNHYSTYGTQHSGHFSLKRVDFRWFTTRKGSKTGTIKDLNRSGFVRVEVYWASKLARLGLDLNARHNRWSTYAHQVPFIASSIAMSSTAMLHTREHCPGVRRLTRTGLG